MSQGSAPRAVALRTLVLTGAAMLCFAGNSVLCRLALAPRLIDAATFTTLRVVSAVAMLSTVVWMQRRQWPRLSEARPLSAAALFAYLIFFSFAYTRLTAGTGALILIGAVQITMFGVAFREGETFTSRQWVGLGTTILGFAYLVLPGVSAPDPLGAVLMATSGIAWGGFSLLARGANRPAEANASNFLCCLLPAVVVNLYRWPEVVATVTGVVLATASGAIASGLGYIVWYLALRELPATRAATVQLSMPAIVALGGAAFLAEPLTQRLLIASAAMIGGIALVLGQRVGHPGP